MFSRDLSAARIISLLNHMTRPIWWRGSIPAGERPPGKPGKSADQHGNLPGWQKARDHFRSGADSEFASLHLRSGRAKESRTGSGARRTDQAQRAVGRESLAKDGIPGGRDRRTETG